MKRRSFLKTGTALMAAATLRKTSGSSTTDSLPPDRLRIGFLGAGHSHAMDKLKVLLESADYEVVGVCDESPAVLAACKKLGVQALAQDKLFSASQVIIVESAVRDHARHTRLALEAGKHVHVEKPPATNLRDLQEIVALAGREKLLLQVGYQWRFSPAFAAVLEAARNGWLGKIYLVRASINNQLAVSRRSEWAEFAGGGMFDLGSHLIDPIVRLLGRPVRVTPFLRTDGGSGDKLRDNNVAVLEFRAALAVVFNATLQPNANAHRHFEILGTEGTASVKPIEPPALQIDLIRDAGPYKPGINTRQYADWRRHAGDFAELAAAVREGKSLSVKGEEELLVQEVLLQSCGMSL